MLIGLGSAEDIEDCFRAQAHGLKVEGMSLPTSAPAEGREESGRRSRTGRWISRDDCGCSGCRFHEGYGDMCNADHKRRRKRKQGVNQVRGNQCGAESEKCPLKSSRKLEQQILGKRPVSSRPEDEIEKLHCENLGEKKAKTCAEGVGKAREGGKSAVDASIDGRNIAGESLGEEEVAGKRRPWDAWTGEEERKFFNALRKVGKNFAKIQERVQTKSKEQVRHHYYQMVKRLNQLLTPSLALDARKFLEANQALLGWWQLMDSDNTNFSKLRSKPKRLKHYVNALERKILIGRKTANRTEMKKAEAAAAAAAEIGVGVSSEKAGSDSGSGGCGRPAGKSSSKGCGASGKAASVGSKGGQLKSSGEGERQGCSLSAPALGKYISRVCGGGKLRAVGIMGKKSGKDEVTKLNGTLSPCSKNVSATGTETQEKEKISANSEGGKNVSATGTETQEKEKISANSEGGEMHGPTGSQVTPTGKSDTDLAGNLALVVKAAAQLEQEEEARELVQSRCGGEEFVLASPEGERREMAAATAHAGSGCDPAKSTGLSVPATITQACEQTAGTLKAQPAEKAKFELQLYPMNELCQRAVELVGQNPHLALKLARRKSMASVVKHLVQKWGRPGTELANFHLVPFADVEAPSSDKLCWDSGSTDATAGDVHARLGSPHVFQLRYLWDLPQPSHPLPSKRPSSPGQVSEPQPPVSPVSACRHETCVHCGQPPAHQEEKPALAAVGTSSSVPSITLPSALASAAPQGVENQQLVVSASQPMLAVSSTPEATRLAVTEASALLSQHFAFPSQSGGMSAILADERLLSTADVPLAVASVGPSVSESELSMPGHIVGMELELPRSDNSGMPLNCGLNRQVEDGQEAMEEPNALYCMQGSVETASHGAMEQSAGFTHCTSIMSPRSERGSPSKARLLQDGNFSPIIGLVEVSQPGLAHWTYEESNDGFGRHAWREEAEDMLGGDVFSLTPLPDDITAFRNAGEIGEDSEMLWVDNASQISIGQLLGYEDIQIGGSKYEGTLQECVGNMAVSEKQLHSPSTCQRGESSAGPSDFSSLPSHGFSSLFHFPQEQPFREATGSEPLDQGQVPPADKDSFQFGASGVPQVPGSPPSGGVFVECPDTFGSPLSIVDSGACQSLDELDIEVELPRELLSREGSGQFDIEVELPCGLQSREGSGQFEVSAPLNAVASGSNMWSSEDACDEFCFPQPAASGQEEEMSASQVLRMGADRSRHQKQPRDFSDNFQAPAVSEADGGAAGYEAGISVPQVSLQCAADAVCDDSTQLDLDWVESFDLPLTSNLSNQHEGILFNGDNSLSMGGVSSLLRRISEGVVSEDTEPGSGDKSTIPMRAGLLGENCTRGAEPHREEQRTHHTSAAILPPISSFTNISDSAQPWGIAAGRGDGHCIATNSELQMAHAGGIGAHKPQSFDAFFSDLPDQVTEEELKRGPTLVPASNSRKHPDPALYTSETSQTVRGVQPRARGGRGAGTEAGKGRGGRGPKSQGGGRGDGNAGKVGDGSADVIADAAGDANGRLDGKSKPRGGGGGGAKRQKVDGGGHASKKRTAANNNEDAIASANRAAAAAMGCSISFGIKNSPSTTPSRPPSVLNTVGPCRM